MPDAARAARVTPQAECSGQHVRSAGSLALLISIGDCVDAGDCPGQGCASQPPDHHQPAGPRV